MGILPPARQVAFHLDDLMQPPATKRLTEFIRITELRVRQTQTILKPPTPYLINQAQSQLQLGLQSSFLRDALTSP